MLLLMSSFRNKTYSHEMLIYGLYTVYIIRGEKKLKCQTVNNQKDATILFFLLDTQGCLHPYHTQAAVPHLWHHSYICMNVPSGVLQCKTCCKEVSIITGVSHLSAYYLQGLVQGDCMNINTHMEVDGWGKEKMVASFLIGEHTVYTLHIALCKDRQRGNEHTHTIASAYNLINLDILALNHYLCRPAPFSSKDNLINIICNC